MSCPADVAQAAAAVGADARALAAVVQVESSGTGFDGRGRPLLRLEAHLLWRCTRGVARAGVDKRFQVLGPEPWQGHRFDGLDYHGHPDLEWRAYAYAEGLDPDAAVRSSSWGLGQVLGDWLTLGFASAQAFVAAQSTRAGQLDTMARFLRAHELIGVLNRHDWSTFALHYNGKGKVADYAAGLAAAYANLG